MKTLLLCLWALLVFTQAHAQTTPVVATDPSPVTSPLPTPTATPTLDEQINQAQTDYYTLQYQLFQAEHDLDITRINNKENDIQAQKNANPMALSNAAMQAYSNLEVLRSKVEMKYTLAQQWYSTIKSGDLAAAKVIQNQIDDMR